MLAVLNLGFSIVYECRIENSVHKISKKSYRLSSTSLHQLDDRDPHRPTTTTAHNSVFGHNPALSG